MRGVQLRRPWGRRSAKSPAAGPAAAGPVIRGVNLGGWLVLEKWMTPSLFGDQTDEYSLCDAADWAALDRIRRHRETFITREDFMWLAEHGISAVRLPIGYWVFGDAAPYRPTVRYVDRAFKWAEETGIQVLLDLHAAPGSQNGADHSGRAGGIAWGTEPSVIQTLEVMMRLVRRYGRHPALLGFELLNEPSPKLKRRVLKRYYQAAYKLIRTECGDEPWVVFSDGFRPNRWRRVLGGPDYTNVYIDTHQYQTFSDADKRLTPLGHIQKTAGQVARGLARMGHYHKVIVGEWNLTLDRSSLQGYGFHELETVRRAYASAQLITYGMASAWFFWSYTSEGGGTQSFRDCVSRGWIPDFGSSELDLGSGRDSFSSASFRSRETEVDKDNGQHQVQEVIGRIDVEQSQDLAAAAGDEADDGYQGVDYTRYFEQYL